MKLHLTPYLMLALAVASAGSSSVQADNLYRTVTGNSGNTWSDTEAWNLGSATGTPTTWDGTRSGDKAFLESGSPDALLVIEEGKTINSTGGMRLSGSNGLTISGGTLQLGGYLEIANNKTLTIESDITGSGLTVSDNSSYTGKLQLTGNVNLTGKLSVRRSTGAIISRQANVTLGGLAIGDYNNTSTKDFVIEDNAILTITGSTNAASNTGLYHARSNGSSFYLGHYNTTGRLLMSGGELNSRSANLYMRAKDGGGLVSLTGGIMNVHGIDFRRTSSNAGGSNPAVFYLGANEDGTLNDTGHAILNLGTDGLIGMNTNDAGVLHFGNATLGTDGASWATYSNSSGGDKNSINLISTKGSYIRPDAGLSITLNHGLTGIGKLIKIGEGTLILNESSNHTGGTEILQGSVQLSDAGKSILGTPGGISLALGAEITGTSSDFTYFLDAGSSLNIVDMYDAQAGDNRNSAVITGNLTLNGGTFITDINVLKSALIQQDLRMLHITGDLTFSANTSFRIGGNVEEAKGLSGVYNLFAVGGEIKGMNSYGLTNDPSSFYTATFNDVGNGIVQMTLTSNIYEWNQAGGGSWDVGSANWSHEGDESSVAILPGKIAIFGDLNGGTHEITVADGMTPGKLFFTNETDSYNLTGSALFLNGDFSIVKQGTGTTRLGLDGASYTGTAELHGGTLAVLGNTLSSATVQFEGGILALENSLTRLGAISGTDDARFHVGVNDDITLDILNDTGELKAKNIILAGGGTLRIDGGTYAGRLDTGDGSIILDTSTGATSVGSFTGTLETAGTGAFELSNTTFNASSGELVIASNGNLNMVSEGNSNVYASDTINITLLSGAHLDANKAVVTGTGTLTMGAGSILTISNGNYAGDFGMKIVLNGGKDGAYSQIRGAISGNNTKITNSISGTGNLHLYRHTNSYYNNPLKFIDGWMNNDYDGNTLITITKAYYMLSGSSVVADGQTITPWGTATGKVTIGGSSFNNGTIARLYTPTAGNVTSYTVANEIELVSNNNDTSLILFAGEATTNEGIDAIDTESRATLTGRVSTNGSGTGKIEIIGSKSLDFQGGLGGTKNLTIRMASSDTTTNEIMFSGDTSQYTGTLTVTGAGLVGMGSGSNTSFGGTIDIGSSTMELRTASITVNGLAGTSESRVVKSTGIDSSTLTINNSADNTYAGCIQGDRIGLTKTNTGTLVLTGENRFGGAMNVKNGQVLVSADMIAGNIIVSGGSLIAGDGTVITGTSLDVTNGASILTVSGTLRTGGTSYFDISGDASLSDIAQVRISDMLDGTASPLRLKVGGTLTGMLSLAGESGLYGEDLFDHSSTVDILELLDPSQTDVQFSWNLDEFNAALNETGNDRWLMEWRDNAEGSRVLTLYYGSIPEPATMTLGSFALAVFLLRRKREEPH